MNDGQPVKGVRLGSDLRPARRIPNDSDDRSRRQSYAAVAAFFRAPVFLPQAPRWSPDGQDLAFHTYDGRTCALYIANATSGARHILPVPGGGKWPTWSRDGQWLYFAPAGGHVGIGKIRTEGGTPVPITHGSDDDIPQESPDGKFVYYNKGWPGQLSVWRARVEGGEETKIIDGVSPRGQWTVGSDGIYFFTLPDVQGRSEIRLYDFATGKAKKILSVQRSVDMKIAVSPEGRTIFYPQIDEQGSDLMLVENFR